MPSKHGLLHVVKSPIDFDTAAAIQRALKEQEFYDLIDEDCSHGGSLAQSTASNPSPIPTVSSLSNLNDMGLKTFQSTKLTSDWFTTTSPLTSPDPSPPSSPRQDKRHLQVAKNSPDCSTASTSLTSSDGTSLSPPFPLQLPRHPPKIGLRPSTLLPPKKADIPPIEPAEESSTSPDRRTRRNRSAKIARSLKREAEKAAGNAHHSSRRKTQEKYLQGALAIETTYTIGDGNRITKPTYIGAPLRKEDLNVEYRLKDLIGPESKFQLRLQKWDGSFSMGILDSQNRIIGVLAGRPDDPTWPTVQKNAGRALERLGPKVHLSRHERENTPRRGDFIALDSGVSFGGGQTKPGNLCNHPTNERILNKLSKMKPFKRIAGFASSVLATWAPDLHRHYVELLNDILRRDSTLTQPFPSTAFSGVSYNFGPKTACYEHTDNTNTAYGMCAATPLGDFDYTKGGHLVLWDLGLVIEFPPGCTILFPSAIIAHSNVMIAEDETRYSFVQYTAGGLFRWVDQGYQTKKEYLSSLSSLQLSEEAERRLERGKKGLSMFLTVDTV